MSGLILGPPGVLPPGEWAVGARVVTRSRRGVLTVAPTPRCSACRLDGGSYAFLADESVVSLDLTTGPLDFGTRALLALVAPWEDQPLCAPGWSPAMGGWRLLLDGRPVVLMSVVGGCPRRALALALAAGLA